MSAESIFISYVFFETLVKELVYTRESDFK